ncbi:MAG: winged helix-turn-helix transcriptional regulator, partial [Eggerthellaceae bacterium]|nr:winged helix-turn-helix transcriptional regulator [Eggerthellaceae bacterium]
KHPDRESALFEVLRRGPATMTNAESDDQDLSFTRLFTYYAGRGIELKARTFAKNLGLLAPSGKYNLLAQLLSDENRMPVRVSIFQGKTKTAPLFSVREFGNTCLLVSLDKVLEYIDVLNVVQADERARVVERKDVPLMDPDVVREAVINAFVHNRWVDGNAPMFTVYSDRLEILSRGTMAPRQTFEGFFMGESVPVNQELSDIFLQLHISERSGRGVPKIVEAYGRDSYEFRPGSIVLTIPFNRIDAPEHARPGSTANAPASLNRTQQQVLDEIRNNPNITHEKLASAIGKGVTTAQKAVRFLRENGYIERVGSDKAGWWRVL